MSISFNLVFVAFLMIWMNCAIARTGNHSASRMGKRVTSICELQQHRDKSSGVRVRLTAIYSSDLLERSTLSDDRCPMVIMVPFDAPKRNQDLSSMRLFNKALEGGGISDRSLRIFEVDISGKYVWRKNEQIHGAIYIEKIWSFSKR